MKTPIAFGVALLLLIPGVSSQVDVKTTELQQRVCRGLWNAVNDHYVYADFRGHDWKAIGAKYQARIQGGLNNDEFYVAMQAMLGELGDEHSYFQSPAQIKAEQAARASQYNFVGIGALMVPIKDTDQAVIMTVFRDSPAAQAGLRSHEIILKVDGGPIREKDGRSRTMGPDGSIVVLTVRRPGQPPRDVTLTRRRVTGATVRDRITAEEFTIAAPWVVNATGAWANQILAFAGRCRLTIASSLEPASAISSCLRCWTRPSLTRHARRSRS